MNYILPPDNRTSVSVGHLADHSNIADMLAMLDVSINVKAYGATGNGTTDDTAAINAAISAATGPANPLLGARYGIAPVFLPPGTYRISSDLIIRSVYGFRFIGAAQDQVRIMPHGTGFTQAALFIDGSTDGVYEGFTIQGDGTESLADAIRLDWTTAAYMSTSGNCLRDVRIVATNFVTGISLEGNGSRQLDGTTFQNVIVNGEQYNANWSSSGNWQAGIAFGNGTFANNYDHRGLGVDATGCYYGYKINGSSFCLDGAQPANNFCDFWIVPGGQCSFRNIQSQSANQFLTTVSAFSPLPVSFEDINIKTTYLNTSNVIANIFAGSWHFKNFCATNVIQPAAPTVFTFCTFVITGASSTRFGVVTFDNLVTNGARTSCILPTAARSQINVRNYVNYNPATGVYTTPVAGDLISAYTGSAWTNVV